MKNMPAVASLPADRREAAALALEARAPSTRRSYRTALARLDRFLAGRPLTDATLAEHVRALADDGMAPATIGIAAAAAAFLAGIAGWPNPRGTMTADALKIVRRDHADRGRGRARSVTADEVTAIIAVARQAERDKDAAIAGLLFQAALRRSEAAALEWRDIEPAADIPGALLIRVRQKKTDQAGDETDVRLVKNGAAEALAAIRPAGAAPTDRVFVTGKGRGRGGRAGLNAQTIGRRFTAAARAAGIEGVTAHSGRIGHASELTARGASTTEVMLSGGWKTPRMVAHYAAGAKAERGAVAKYL
ncbi:MAG: tyrosine-type recombinase/integrase [Rhodospirillaceae bacterium]|nr:tyrosine-type recombinase/integrase [Rhodospirillaceae bacterium]